jgi:hypothetical protein
MLRQAATEIHVPTEHLKIARHFNAGMNPKIKSPAGTAEVIGRPCGT